MQLELVERIRDIHLETQILAIKAATLLQTPEDKYCPIINSFLGLLQRESLPEIRSLVIEKLVITSHTYRIFKHFLMYDTNLNLQNKILSELEKKVPNKYYDLQFKHDIINCLYRNENSELLEKFVLKWSDQLDASKFLKSIDIRAFYQAADILQLDTLFEKVSQVIMAYLKTNSILQIIIYLNKTFAEDDLVDNFEACVLFYYLFHYCKKHDQISDLAQHLLVDCDGFENMVMKKFEDSATKLDSYLLYNLVEIYCLLAEMNFNELSHQTLERFISLVDLNNETNTCLIKVIVEKMEYKMVPKFIWGLYSQKFKNKTNDESLLKLLNIIFYYVGR